MRVTGALPEPDGSLTGVRIGYDAEAAFPLGRGASGAARVRPGPRFVLAVRRRAGVMPLTAPVAIMAYVGVR